MNLITKRTLIDAFPDRFYHTYVETKGGLRFLPNRVKQYEQIIANPPKTEAEITEMMGNESWMRLQCDHCHKDVERAACMNVTAGEYTTYLCQPCIEEALRVVTEGLQVEK